MHGLLAVVLGLDRLADAFECGLERLQVPGTCLPQNRWIGVMIVVPDDIADAGDFAPRDLAFRVLERLRQAAARLRDQNTARASRITRSRMAGSRPSRVTTSTSHPNLSSRKCFTDTRSIRLNLTSGATSISTSMSLSGRDVPRAADPN